MLLLRSIDWLVRFLLFVQVTSVSDWLIDWLSGLDWIVFLHLFDHLTCDWLRPIFPEGVPFDRNKSWEITADGRIKHKNPRYYVCTGSAILSSQLGRFSPLFPISWSQFVLPWTHFDFSLQIFPAFNILWRILLGAVAVYMVRTCVVCEGRMFVFQNGIFDSSHPSSLKFRVPLDQDYRLFADCHRISLLPELSAGSTNSNVHDRGRNHAAADFPPRSLHDQKGPRFRGTVEVDRRIRLLTHFHLFHHLDHRWYVWQCYSSFFHGIKRQVCCIIFRSLDWLIDWLMLWLLVRLIDWLIDLCVSLFFSVVRWTYQSGFWCFSRWNLDLQCYQRRGLLWRRRE